ncbi:Ig-like domain (group 2), partial [Natronincola peptidivorans]
GLEIIISEAAAGEAIILEGSFDSITIEADDVNIVTQGETNIEEVVVKEGVKGAAISLGNDTIITKLVADARIGVEGEGTIIEASGEEVRNSTFAKDPERMITPMAPSIGGGGGGSSGGGTPSTVAVSAITVSPTTLTLTAGGATSTITATVSPENATNKNVVWLSSNPAVANVDGGVVTPVAEGTVIITATSAADGTKSATSVVTVNAAVNNEPQMTASPTQVTVESGFNQTFTLTIENDTVTNAVYTEYILLGGVFAEMNLGDIDRSNDTTVTAAVYGNLTNTGIGKITLDADALVNSESNLTVSVTVVEGTVGAITVTGNAVVGATLTAETNPDTATGSYQWQSNNNGDWVNIGTDSNTYTIDVEDVGNAIRVVFEAFGNYTGEVKSDAVGPVVPEGPNNGTDDGEFFVDAVKDKVTIVNGDGDIDGYTAHVYVDGTLVESETL